MMLQERSTAAEPHGLESGFLKEIYYRYVYNAKDGLFKSSFKNVTKTCSRYNAIVLSVYSDIVTID
jgi:hypothetical protein